MSGVKLYLTWNNIYFVGKVCMLVICSWVKNLDFGWKCNSGRCAGKTWAKNTFQKLFVARGYNIIHAQCCHVGNGLLCLQIYIFRGQLALWFPARYTCHQMSLAQCSALLFCGTVKSGETINFSLYWYFLCLHFHGSRCWWLAVRTPKYLSLSSSRGEATWQFGLQEGSQLGKWSILTKVLVWTKFNFILQNLPLRGNKLASEWSGLCLDNDSKVAPDCSDNSNLGRRLHPEIACEDGSCTMLGLNVAPNADLVNIFISHSSLSEYSLKILSRSKLQHCLLDNFKPLICSETKYFHKYNWSSSIDFSDMFDDH